PSQLARRGGRSQSDGAEGAAFPSESQARHLSLSQWRAFAGGHVRSQAHAGQVSSPASARRKSSNRAKDRNAAAVAIHFQEIWPERHGHQRNLSETRAARR